ncbi:MAG: hypothetical protein ACM3X3_10855 [Betaproteobacteria bacterium]
MPRATLCEIIDALGGRRGLRDRRVMKCYLAARKFDRGWVRGFAYAGPVSGLMAALGAAMLASETPRPQPENAA